MDAQAHGLSEDALCSLLDKGVAWLEEFDSRLKNRAAELERKESDLAHRMQLADQLESDFAERERRIADARSHVDEHARRVADQEQGLRAREQHERGEVRSLREQYEMKLREVDDRDASLKRLEIELVARRRAVEVCESAIARFQQTFERVLETRPDTAHETRSSGEPRAGALAPEPRIAAVDAILCAQTRDASSVRMERDRSPHASDMGSPAAMCVSGADSWGEWQGPMR
jgi:hypothetical protein